MRNLVERFFSRIEEFRRFATLHDNADGNNAAAFYLVARAIAMT